MSICTRHVTSHLILFQRECEEVSGQEKEGEEERRGTAEGAEAGQGWLLPGRGRWGGWWWVVAGLLVARRACLWVGRWWVVGRHAREEGMPCCCHAARNLGREGVFKAGRWGFCWEGMLIGTVVGRQCWLLMLLGMAPGGNACRHTAQTLQRSCVGPVPATYTGKIPKHKPE